MKEDRASDFPGVKPMGPRTLQQDRHHGFPPGAAGESEARVSLSAEELARPARFRCAKKCRGGECAAGDEP